MEQSSLSKHVPIERQKRRNYRSFSVEPISPHIGAEIRGVDLADLNDELIEDIKAAWLDWMVLVFRDQSLDREAHKAFGRCFGKLHVHLVNQNRPDQDPEIFKVQTTDQNIYTAGEAWHSDVTCDEVPPLASALYMTKIPECGGGDTLFANMCMAYEMLSPSMKAFLADKTAVHNGGKPYDGDGPPSDGYPKQEHPVVATHPVTRRKVLYVNAGYTTHIVGLKGFESRVLLEMCHNLLRTEPKLHCRVCWEPNTLTFWDNRCTQHHAVWDYFPYSRYGERVSIVGTQPPVA